MVLIPANATASPRPRFIIILFILLVLIVLLLRVLRLPVLDLALALKLMRREFKSAWNSRPTLTGRISALYTASCQLRSGYFDY